MTDAEPRVAIAMAIVVRDGQILLGHRHPRREWFPDCWDVVGGHIEDGETPRQALARECLEELGIEVVAAAPFPLTLTIPGIDAHAFLVCDWTGEPVNAAPHEHDAIGWFRAADLDSLTVAHPAMVGQLTAALSAPSSP